MQSPLDAIAEEIKEESEQSDRVNNLPKKHLLEEESKISKGMELTRSYHSINNGNTIQSMQS
jgi:hypothetical protein